jgi:general secretion pathway protein J
MTRSSPGFTLVELLVALLIFGMLAAAGVMLLRFSVDAQSAATTKLDAIGAARRIDSLLAADMAQAVPRATRDAAGRTTPAFAGTPDGFTLVRGGWDNLDDAPRASLMRVEYRLSGGQLVRRQWPMLDGAAPEPAATLVDRVAGLRLRYRALDGWRDRWDPIRLDALPRAVELVVRRVGAPEYRYVLLVGAGA